MQLYSLINVPNNAVFLLSVVDSSTTTTSNEQVFRNIVGTIVSPNYPKNYGNNENRNYKILAPTQTEIVLIFNNFDVEYDDSCARDSLKVIS